MTRRALPLAAIALLTAPCLALQGSVRPFPARVSSRGTAMHPLSLESDLEAVRDLGQLDDVHLTGLVLPTGETVDLQLVRIDLDRLRFAFFVDGEARADLLDNLDLSLWKGHVVGSPDSEVRLSFSNYGLRGSVNHAGELCHFMPRENAGGGWLGCDTFMTTERSLNGRGQSLGQFCDAGESRDGTQRPFAPFALPAPDVQSSTLPPSTDTCDLRECTVAVETDYQLFQVFNDLPTQTAYITTLLGYVSDLYEDQIGTSLTYPYVMFYTNAADPWTTPDLPSTPFELLTEFRVAWANNIPTNASLGHFISGATLGGGAAFLGTINRPTSAFGVSASIRGLTSFPILQQPFNWDFVVIAHELGHGFHSPHTHEFCPPIDNCAPSSEFGPCQSQQMCDSNGTIMSYCNICFGGTANITNRFHSGPVALMRTAAQAWLPLLHEASVVGESIVSVRSDGPTLVTATASDPAVISDVTLMYSYGGSGFLSTPMTDVGQGVYRGSLPAASCNSKPEYYFSFNSPTCGAGTDPRNASVNTFSAGAGIPTIHFTDDFETDTGWTVENVNLTAGRWERAVPVNLPLWPYPPAEDFDGGGQCFVTHNGQSNTDVDGVATRLISPDLDVQLQVAIQYAYYLFLEDPSGTDALVVEWSSNGGAGPWIEIARHHASDLEWQTHVISQADMNAAGVQYSANTKLRFTVNDAGDDTIVEAGLDNVRIFSIDCEAGTSFAYCTTSPNSASAGAVISSVGSLSLSANAFFLTSGAGVPNAPGLFYYGTEPVQAPFGDGVRCVGGATQRLFPFVTFSSVGSAFRQLDFSGGPVAAGPHAIQPGRTYYFQHWFRDGAAGMSGYNVSNGLAVVFTF